MTEGHVFTCPPPGEGGEHNTSTRPMSCTGGTPVTGLRSLWGGGTPVAGGRGVLCEKVL